MKAPEQHRRPRRNPLSREEVEAIIAFKERKEQLKLYTLRQTFSYKARNLFLIFCFFIFSEVIMCYFGPARHRMHYTQTVMGIFDRVYDKEKGQLLKEIDVICVEGSYYKLLIDDFQKVPPKFTRIDVCSDFLLNCQLKATIDGLPGTYRLFRADPVLLLCLFSSFILLLGIHHNLNQNDYTLWGLTVLCGMTVFYLAVI